MDLSSLRRPSSTLPTHHFAPGIAEGPRGQDVVGGGEGHAEEHEEDVRDGEAVDQEVRRGPHRGVDGDNCNDTQDDDPISYTRQQAASQPRTQDNE